MHKRILTNGMTWFPKIWRSGSFDDMCGLPQKICWLWIRQPFSIQSQKQNFCGTFLHRLMSLTHCQNNRKYGVISGVNTSCWVQFCGPCCQMNLFSPEIEKCHLTSLFGAVLTVEQELCLTGVACCRQEITSKKQKHGSGDTGTGVKNLIFRLQHQNVGCRVNNFRQSGCQTSCFILRQFHQFSTADQISFPPVNNGKTEKRKKHVLLYVCHWIPEATKKVPGRCQVHPAMAKEVRLTLRTPGRHMTPVYSLQLTVFPQTWAWEIRAHVYDFLEELRKREINIHSNISLFLQNRSNFFLLMLIRKSEFQTQRGHGKVKRKLDPFKFYLLATLGRILTSSRFSYFGNVIKIQSANNIEVTIKQ